MPTSPINRFQLSDSSTNNFECSRNISDYYEEKESMMEMKRMSKFRFNHGHALLRKPIQKPIVLQTSKGKRRNTISGHYEHKVPFKKRRRLTEDVVFPTKFLLGGNINDPLNLRSLQDEKINQQLNAMSPEQVPVPMPYWRTRVQVIVPHNIHDPLNLNSGEEIGFNLMTSRPRRRKRHRKCKRDDEGLDDGNQISPTEEVPPSYVSTHSQVFLCSLDDSTVKDVKNIPTKLEFSEDQTLSGKIVSPVIPQGSPVKTFKKSLSRSISRDVEDKSVSNNIKYTSAKLRSRQNAMKFRANAEKFCYGNHVTNTTNWNFGNDCGSDPRLRFFDQNLFRGRDILDIGCNTGEFTLHIARFWQPHKVIGIDIDKKLINKAQRLVRFLLSEEIGAVDDFPESMPVMYGPLSKLAMSTSRSRTEFPNNVTFLEANYVPANEECLETQKPEYDIILCLRVTKWIHLNFGDEGLKMAFKRMFAQLRYGGHLILESQPWFTYSASKRITPAIYKTYQGLHMRPDIFCEYLLSEVGFTSCQLIGRSINYKKDYRQDIYLLTKGYPSPMLRVSPMAYCDIWTHDQSEEFPEFDNEDNVGEYQEFNHAGNIGGYQVYDHEANYQHYEHEANYPEYEHRGNYLEYEHEANYPEYEHGGNYLEYEHEGNYQENKNEGSCQEYEHEGNYQAYEHEDSYRDYEHEGNYQAYEHHDSYLEYEHDSIYQVFDHEGNIGEYQEFNYEDNCEEHKVFNFEDNSGEYQELDHEGSSGEHQGNIAGFDNEEKVEFNSEDSVKEFDVGNSVYQVNAENSVKELGSENIVIELGSEGSFRELYSKGSVRDLDNKDNVVLDTSE